MTEKTLTTENIKPALDALRGELAPWPVVAKKQDRLNTAQLNAANSGITSSLVAQIIANTAAIRALESAITGTGLRALVVATLPAVGTTGILYIVPVTTYDPETDADVVNYSNEYLWIVAPDAPVTEGYYEQVGQTGIVINNGQLTITVNGTSVGTFTANQSGDTTAAITVPTNADYVDLSTSQTVTGGKTWTGEQSFTLPIVGSITGTASKAIADEDGTSIKSGYVNVAGNQTVTGQKTWTGEQTFSQTIQGNAATASAFDTAKSITLTGAVTGTVSGTNSWEITTALKTGSAATGGTVTNPYFKIASWEVAPNDYFGTILQIQNKFYPNQIATLTIGLRTKSDATFQRGYSLLNNAIGIQSSAFILCYKEVTGKVLCELYYYTTTPFNGIRFSVISEGTRNDSSVFNTMVVYKNPAGIAALPSDYTTIQTSIGTYSQDFIPYSTNTYALGTSTNQWSSVYAQTYYYNGTAWGLDKANVWTTDNQFNGSNMTLKNGLKEVGSASSGGHYTIAFWDKNNERMGWIQHLTEYIRIGCRNKFTNNVLDPNGSWKDNYITIYVKNDGTKYTAFLSDTIPEVNNAYNLGTSTNKWKSINGINPGALSLLKTDAMITIGVSEFLFNGTDEFMPDVSGLFSSGIAQINGWLVVRLKEGTGHYIFLNSNISASNPGVIQSCFSPGVVTTLQFGLSCYVPVCTGHKPSVRWAKPDGGNASIYFIPCLGNV